jgi:hypothetical protein
MRCSLRTIVWLPSMSISSYVLAKWQATLRLDLDRQNAAGREKSATAVNVCFIVHQLNRLTGAQYQARPRAARFSISAEPQSLVRHSRAPSSPGAHATTS